MEEKFQNLLDEAVHFHGHLCGGQVIGVRMAMAALRELGIQDPKGREGRDLVIFVEADRCATDAIIAVTGRTPGKRSIKMLDYGKMAATFVDCRTGQAVRISARGDSGALVERMAQAYLAAMDAKQAIIEALKAVAEDQLLRIQHVRVALRPEDLPGEPLDSVSCDQCGELIKDRRQVRIDHRTLCRPCAAGSDYYEVCGAEKNLKAETSTEDIAHAIARY